MNLDMPNFKKPMLATTCDFEGDFGEYYYASTKFDGIRCMAQNGMAISRALEEIPNREIQRAFKDAADLIENMDGELISGYPYGKGVFARTNLIMTEDAQNVDFGFYVYDLMEQNPFVNRWEKLRDKKEELREVLPWVHIVPHFRVTSSQDVDYLTNKFVGIGYEGAVARKGSALYKHGKSGKKSGEMFKFKRWVDAEAIIVGFEEEMQNCNEATVSKLGRTKRSSHKANKVGKSTLGKLVLVGINGDFEGVSFKCGTGFTREMRKEIWENQERYAGKIAKYKYTPIGVKDKPRHPVFLGIRASMDMS